MQAESRDGLKAEVVKLRAQVAQLQVASTSTSSSGTRETSSPSRGLFAEHVSRAYDDSASLYVDEITSSLNKNRTHDETAQKVRQFLAGQEARSRHPTARTITMDLDHAPRKNTSSKYFDHDKENDVMGSSPARRARDSTSRTNPFATSRQESQKRRELPTALESAEPPAKRRLIEAVEVIDLTDTPDSKRGVSKSLVEQLGLADRNGRPSKSAVGGARVHRRV